MRVFLILIVLLTAYDAVGDTEVYEKVDPRGYIVYCPCMGRFGNQADHFLGSFEFAKVMDRTLVVPPWIEYVYPSSVQIPFDRYFDISELKKYHRVILMHTFMKQIAPTLWPADKRISFCHGPRGKGKDCAAKEGNPFGPFWNHFRISFMESEFFAPHLTINIVNNPAVKNNWDHIYPPKRYPVIAFTGAPASFPVVKEHVFLSKYMKWSTYIDDKATQFIKNTLPKGPYLGIHLRRDIDWDNVCELVGDENRHLFSSPQCLGYEFEFGKLNMQLCKPTWKEIASQVVKTAKRIKAKSVFVSSDKNAMIDDLNVALKGLNIKAYTVKDANPHVSLALLTKSNHFIGNCLSSFSAFVKRYRDNQRLPSSFWNFKQGAVVESTAILREAEKTEL